MALHHAAAKALDRLLPAVWASTGWISPAINTFLRWPALPDEAEQLTN